MIFFRKKKIDKAAWAALVYEQPLKNIVKEHEEQLELLRQAESLIKKR